MGTAREEPNETLHLRVCVYVCGCVRVCLRVCVYVCVLHMGSDGGRGASRRSRCAWWWCFGIGARSLLHVTLQEEHDGRVALRSLLELLQRDLVVVVLIHFAEDLVHPLLRCQAVFVHLHHDHRANHFVDGLRKSQRINWC